MANMIDLDSFRKISEYFNLKTRSLYFVEPMESIFGHVPPDSDNIEHSTFNEKCFCFSIISDVKLVTNSPLVPCMLSSFTI